MVVIGAMSAIGHRSPPRWVAVASAGREVTSLPGRCASYSRIGKGCFLSERLIVQVDGDELIVFLPGTDYIATFYRATPGELLAKSHAGHEVGDAPMTCAEFQGRAWQAANAKARELGWIV